MRAYTNAYAEVVAAFTSGVVMTPRDIKDRRDDYAERTETGTVPGTANDYSVLLDYGILKQEELTVENTTSSTFFTVIPYGDAPGAGEVSVNFDLGLLIFD